MSKPKRPARKPLEVTVMFEPNRLALTHLIGAYRQVVPLRHRSVPTPSDPPAVATRKAASMSGDQS